MDEQQEALMDYNPAKNDFLVVGIGASAGGLEALQTFFQHVPANSDMAYVVILHLSPDHDSQLATILGRSASIPVTQVTEKVQIEPNRVYVVPPNQHLTMENEDIAVTPNLFVEERRAPVDIFFRTLGEVYHARAVGVILSGTGANGSMGIKRIKECGGAAFVQNPREAQFNEMPRNSIATDLIDGILPVAEIPAKIIAYRNSLGITHITEKAKERPEDQQQALREIFTQLRVRTGHDFTNYKRATLLRRLERRINVHNLVSLSAYAAFMQQNPEEAVALLKDLLISVTNFFRDKKAFDYIDTDILPRILVNKNEGSAVRLWIAGCATGEEAYSLAMLCAERTLNQIDAPKVQIFATDIDETAITAAREGLYTLNDAADVSPERLRRFFTKEGESYRIRREIREMVLFAKHNLLKDPPFSHVDMVSCRNLLIYLNQTAQERVLETIHFALEPGGYLFLGTSENSDGASDLFAITSREHHVYQSRAVASRPFPVPDTVPQFIGVRRIEVDIPQETEARQLSRLNYADLHQQLLEQYAPPSAVINEEYDIVHLSERAGKYLQIAGGEISKNLLKLIRPELRLELRTALYQAIQRRSNVEVKDLKVQVDDTTETINIHVRPVLREDDNNRGFLLVLFEAGNSSNNEDIQVVYTADEPIARHLEEELVRTKTRLRSTIEQHELQAEELKASNEELQAMNEELRSAAEELETGKEELQSINEELTTVNQELKVKIEETTISNNNFQNLINSTDIATIFLDRSLRIKMFTPAARSIFNMIPADIGRPVSDITNKLQYTGLIEDAEYVLDKLQMVEREVRTDNHNFYLLRALPYRTEEDRINGVVVTFINITERRKAEEAERKSEERFRAFVTASSDVVYRMNADWTEMFFLKGADFLINSPDHGKTWQEKYIPKTEQSRVLAAIQEAIRTKSIFELEHQVHKADGTIGWTLSRAVPLQNERGEITEWFGIANDITARVEAERKIKDAEEKYRKELEYKVVERTAKLQESQHQYASLIENTPDVITRWDKDLKLVFANSAFYDKTGVPLKRLYGKDNIEMGQPEAIAVPYMESLRKTFDTGEPVEHYNAFPTSDGDVFYYSRMIPERNAAGEVETVIAIARDITEIRKAQQEILKLKDEIAQQATDKYLKLFNSMDEGFYQCEVIFDENNEPIDIHYIDENPAAVRISGQNFIGKTLKQINPDYENYWFEIWGEVALTGQSRRLERYSGPDKKWFNFYVSKVGDENSRQVAVLFQDITERKKTEEALRQSEERMRLLIESAKDYAIFTINIERQVISWSSGAEAMIGYSEQEIIGQKGDIIFTPEDREKGDPENEAATAAEKGCADNERWHLRKDGTRFWDSGVTNALLDASGKVIGFVKIMRDLTARREAEEALREREEHNRALVSQTSVGIVHTDLNGKLIFMNDKACSMFGFNPVNGGENSIWEFSLAEDLEENQRLYNRLVQEGLPFQFERKLKRLNGTSFWALVSMSPIKNRDGRTGSAVGIITDVTGRKQAEEALRETMERFQYAVQATKDVIWEIDFNRNHVWWSSMMHTLFGYSQKEIQHSVAWYQSLIHPDDRKHVVRNFSAAIEGNENIWADEFRYQQASGAYMYVTCRSFIIRNATGKALRMIGAMQDVTERRLAEEAVRKSEERLRVTMESATDFVIITSDTNGNIERWNSGAERIFGWSAQEAIGKYTDFFYVPEDRAAGIPKKEMTTASDQGRAPDERWHLCKDGTRIFLSGVLAPIWNNGSVTGFVKVARDMTAQKEVEDALQTAQNSLNTALEAAQMGVWDIDLATDTVIRSPRHDQLLGFDHFQQEWTHEKAKQHMVEEDKAKFDAARKQMFETGIFELEARVLGPEKNFSWVRLYGRIFKNDKGEPTHAAGVIFDITDRKTVEQKKDEFVGIASHELKTPVTAIKAYTEILHEQFVERGDTLSADFLQKLNGQVDRLTGLIKDLLDATRISEGRLIMRFSEFDMNEMLHSTAEDLQRTTSRHKIELHLQELPPYTGDRERLQQVFINLIANAVKYSPEADNILLSAYRDNGNIAIAVQDFGVGMSPETQGKLFERFFRSSDPNIATFPGLGLGLYISMEIVKQHKGTIHVQSEKGKGSVFTVVLPVEG